MKPGSKGRMSAQQMNCAKIMAVDPKSCKRVQNEHQCKREPKNENHLCKNNQVVSKRTHQYIDCVNCLDAKAAVQHGEANMKPQ